jgi:hypothetical protein
MPRKRVKPEEPMVEFIVTRTFRVTLPVSFIREELEDRVTEMAYEYDAGGDHAAMVEVIGVEVKEAT